MELKEIGKDGKVKLGLSDTGLAIAIGLGIAVAGGVIGYRLGVRAGVVKTKAVMSEQILMALI